jgi:hypothetical protein
MSQTFSLSATYALSVHSGLVNDSKHVRYNWTQDSCSEEQQREDLAHQRPSDKKI